MKWHDYQTFSPVKNELNVPFTKVQEAELVKVSVFNLTGEKVQEYQCELLSGNISLGNTLSKGFWVVQVESKVEKKIYRIFKN